jgi:glycine oxidase
MVVDDQHRHAASRAAGGIINPITGKRLNRPALIDDLLQQAFSTYPAIEQLLNDRIFTRRNVLRLFADEKEAERWRTKRELPEYRKHVSPCNPEMSANVTDSHGGIEIATAAQLDIRRLIESMRSWLRLQDRIREEPLQYDQIRVSAAGVEWHGMRAQFAIFCEGYGMRANPYFNAIELNPAKGEVLTLRAPEFFESRIIQKGKWIFRSLSGDVLAGTTYRWDDLDDIPTAQAKEEIQRAISDFCRFRFTIADQRAGVRAVTKLDNRPLVGAHPLWPRLAILNGFGSKGALQVPFAARQLLENLETGCDLHPEIDVCRQSLWK